MLTGMATATPVTLEAGIKAAAHRLGFHLAGITTADPADTGGHYADWVEAGHAGEMGYMARDLDRRQHPRSVMPEARSVVVVGLLYNTGEADAAGRAPDVAPSSRGPAGQIACYAVGDDYHQVMKARLDGLLAWIRAEAGHDVYGRAYVDTGPLLERDLARRAGLGWFGKNTMLLHPRMGSYFFLGALMLDLPLAPDEPFAREHCGTCRRCLDACPTGAFVAPHVLDARRCISYLTIELRGPIPRELRPLVGDWIFGCDVCQEVCPWNRKAPLSDEPAFRPRSGFALPELIPLLSLTQEEFSTHFKGSPIKRAKRRGLLRNVAVALGNSGDRAAVPALVAALSDSEPLVRAHAAWALGRLGGGEAAIGLRAARAAEGDPLVREELDLALVECEASGAEAESLGVGAVAGARKMIEQEHE
jgi:epoxyqueuosine reductase